MKTQPYYYGHQIERYLIQFANVFSGFQVKTGIGDKEQMVSVPIMYGSIDKVVASIEAGNTQNRPIRIPVISTHLSAIEMAPEYRHGVGQEDRFSYLKSGGSIPEDVRVLHRYMPVPYKLTCEVYTYCSNQHQQFQLLEQIMVLFDPSLVIQTTDARFDWTKLTSVDLTDISLDENVPVGDAERLIVTKLQFSFVVWLTPPAKSKTDFVESIIIRLADLDELIDNADNFFNGSADMSNGVTSQSVQVVDYKPPV